MKLSLKKSLTRLMAMLLVINLLPGFALAEDIYPTSGVVYSEAIFFRAAPEPEPLQEDEEVDEIDQLVGSVLLDPDIQVDDDENILIGTAEMSAKPEIDTRPTELLGASDTEEGAFDPFEESMLLLEKAAVDIAPMAVQPMIVLGKTLSSPLIQNQLSSSSVAFSYSPRDVSLEYVTDPADRLSVAFTPSQMLITPRPDAKGPVRITVTATYGGLTVSDFLDVNIEESPEPDVNGFFTITATDISTAQNVVGTGTGEIYELQVSDIEEDEEEARIFTVTATSLNQSVIQDSGINITNTNGKLAIRVTPVKDAISINGTPITLTAADQNGLTASVTIQVYILHMNTPPVTKDIAGTIKKNKSYKSIVPADDSKDGLFRATGFAFSIASGSGPTNGTVDLNPDNGAFTYKPQKGYEGTDTFTVTVKENKKVHGNMMPRPTPTGATAYPDETLSVNCTITVTVKKKESSSGGGGGGGSGSSSGGGGVDTDDTDEPEDADDDEDDTVYDDVVYDDVVYEDGGIDDLTVIMGGFTPDGLGIEQYINVTELAQFAFLDGMAIPAGAAAAFACTNGLLIQEDINRLLTELNGGEETFLYDIERLNEIFDMRYQMMLPINFDEIDWTNVPPEGLEFPLIVWGDLIVGKMFLRPTVNEFYDDGYALYFEFATGIIASPEYATMHFVGMEELVRMIEAQSMSEDNYNEIDMFNGMEFISKELLTGRQMLFVSLPCVFVPEQLQKYMRTELEVQEQYDLAMIGEKEARDVEVE